jgi:hypothetical protein
MIAHVKIYAPARPCYPWTCSSSIDFVQRTASWKKNLESYTYVKVWWKLHIYDMSASLWHQTQYGDATTCIHMHTWLVGQYVHKLLEQDITKTNGLSEQNLLMTCLFDSRRPSGHFRPRGNTNFMSRWIQNELNGWDGIPGANVADGWLGRQICPRATKIWVKEARDEILVTEQTKQPSPIVPYPTLATDRTLPTVDSSSTPSLSSTSVAGLDPDHYLDRWPHPRIPSSPSPLHALKWIVWQQLT